MTTKKDETKALIKGALREAEAVTQHVVIEDKFALDATVAMLSRIKAKIKELTNTRLSLTRPLDDSKKKIMELFKMPIERLKMAEDNLKKGIEAYSKAQEQKAQEENLRRRIQAERELKKEKDALEKQAKQADKAGNLELATEIREQKDNVIGFVDTSEPEKIEGAHIKKLWRYEVVDVNILPKQFMIPDHEKLSKYANAMKENAKVPGVQFFVKESVAVTKK